MKEKSQDYIIIFSLWLLVFAASSQIMIIAPILPRIGEQLSIGSDLLGMLVTAYAVMTGLFALIMGPVSDKIGRRKILLLGTCGMFIALSLHGIANNYISLLTVRGLAGAAGGILSGAAVTYVGDYFPYERRGWANGWIMSGIAMGQILGIPIGTILADIFGFQAPFLAFAIIMAIAFIIIYKFIPQPNVTRDITRLTLKAALSKYQIMLKNGVILSASLSYFLMFLSVSVYIVFLPTWLEHTFQVGGSEIATLFLIGGIANVITGPIAGRLSDTIGRKMIIITSCIGFSILMIGTTFWVKQFWIAYPLFFFLMVLVAMRISPFQTLVTELVDSKQRGALMSLLVAIGQVGFGLGGAIAGPVYVSGGFLVNTQIGAVFIFLMALIVWRFIPEPELERQIG